MLDCFHIIKRISCLTGNDTFRKNQRYYLASFLKMYGIIIIFKLTRKLFIWSNFLIKTNTVSQFYDPNKLFINWDALKEHYKLQE